MWFYIFINCEVELKFRENCYANNEHFLQRTDDEINRQHKFMEDFPDSHSASFLFSLFRIYSFVVTSSGLPSIAVFLVHYTWQIDHCVTVSRAIVFDFFNQRDKATNSSLTQCNISICNICELFEWSAFCRLHPAFLWTPRLRYCAKITQRLRKVVFKFVFVSLRNSLGVEIMMTDDFRWNDY